MNIEGIYNYVYGYSLVGHSWARLDCTAPCGTV